MQPNPYACRSRTAAMALAVALSMALPAGCQRPAGQVSLQKRTSTAPLQAELPDYDPAADLRRHAAAVFVDPLVDDSDPPRFTEAKRVLVCGDRSRVMVDGRPLVEGDLVPPGAFVLQWDMDLYCPYGIAGPLLNGRAEVLVFRDDEQGLSAVLRPVSLDVLEPPLLLDDSATRSAGVDADLAATARTAAGR